MTGVKIFRDGKIVAADKDFLTQQEIDQAVDIVVLRDRLKREIDSAAEAARLRYITPGAGQAMTYQQKIDEVWALAQDAEPTPENYPLLAAEIGITAPSLDEVAAVVLAAYQQWRVIGRAIEAARLAGKKAISDAETPEAAKLAADGVVWP